MARQKIGIALSGGTAKSVAHVGVLKALTEAGIPIDYIAGTSGGSIVSSMVASGMPISSMEAVATTMNWRKLVTLRFTKLGFVSSARIEEFVKEIIGDLDFEDLKVPSTVVTANLVTGEKREFRSGRVALAVRASCSIPQIYLPVEIEGEYYVDGGVAEYLPIESLAAMGCDICIGSHLGPVNFAYRRPHHLLHLVMQITGLMARKNYISSLARADFVIHPNLDHFSSFDFNNSDKMIQLGYNTTWALMDDLKKVIKRRNSFWGRCARVFRKRT
jgi:NTE family protein